MNESMFKENRFVFFAGKGPDAQKPFDVKEGMQKGGEQMGSAWENLKDAKDDVKGAISDSCSGAVASATRNLSHFKNKWEGKLAQLTAKGADKGVKVASAYLSELGSLERKAYAVLAKVNDASDATTMALNKAADYGVQGAETVVNVNKRVYKTVGKSAYKVAKGAGGVVKEAWEESAE